MKRIILSVFLTLLSLGNTAIAQAKHSDKALAPQALSATQIANERTEQDAKLYSFTSDQKKKAYQTNLEIGHQLVAAGEHMHDKELLRLTEKTRFQRYSTFLNPEQMLKFQQDYHKQMDKLAQ